MLFFNTVGEPVFLPFQWHHIYEEQAFVGWAAELSMWGAPMKNDKSHCVAADSSLVLFGRLDDWSLMNKDILATIDLLTIDSFNRQPHSVWKNQTQPQQPLLLMLVTSLVTLCCGMASHSSTSICPKSANVVVLITLAWTEGPSWSQNGVQWGWGQDCRPSSPLLLYRCSKAFSASSPHCDPTIHVP